MLTQVIDQLYEASVAVERWHGLLAQLTDLAGGAGASLLSGGQRPTRWIATPAIDRLIEDYAGQPHPNSRMPAGLPRSLDGFLGDLDFFTPEQIEADPFYTEFLWPRGFGWCLGTTIAAPGVDPVIFSVERHRQAGPATPEDKARFNALRPHMARAMLLSARVNLERAQAKAQILGVLGLPAAVIDAQGRGLAVNDPFHALVPKLVQDRRGRFTFTNPAADKVLVEALRRFNGADYSGAQSVPVPAVDALPASVAHIIPVCGLAHDIFSPGLALLLLTPLTPSPGPAAHLLEALFDLTPAEAQIARAVAEAQRLEDVARARGVTKETIRLQLRSAFAKTGTRRQSELVRLLAGVPNINSGRS